MFSVNASLISIWLAVEAVWRAMSACLLESCLCLGKKARVKSVEFAFLKLESEEGDGPASHLAP